MERQEKLLYHCLCDPQREAIEWILVAAKMFNHARGI